MQKLIISILCIFIITGSALAKAPSSKFKQGVIQYKSGNYIGSMETMQSVVQSDPGNAIAHYYLAISYVKLGNKDSAVKEYNNVIALNSAPKLVEYAKQGLSLLGVQQTDTGTLKVPDLNNLPQITNIPGVKPASDYITDKVKDTIREKEINKVINDANNKNGEVDPNSLKRIDSFSNKKSENVTPSKDEISKAMQVLSSAGMYQNFNPETMQMNMLMNSLGGQQDMSGMSGMNGGYGYNPMASMMPMMMMAQGSNQKMDPQLMETMMTTMMMPGMMQMNSGNNENNY